MSSTEVTDQIAAQQEHGHANIDRDDAIKAIRAALKRRSGKAWSVTGDRGTAWGWINITAPKKRRTGKFIEDGVHEAGHHMAGMTRYTLVDSGEPQEYGHMTPADCEELAALLGFDVDANTHSGYSIPASTGHRIEYIARAEGRSPSEYGQQYWD